MEAKFKDKLRYRFEKFLNKGGSSMFISLFVLFLVLFLLMVLFRWIMMLIWPDLNYTGNFFRDIWIIWLQMTDPGNMNQDNESPGALKVITILSGVIGVIILSMLIAFITTTLEKVFYEFRKGRGKIFEEDFTLILGWNERVVDIIRELILANESESYGAVVILSHEDKEKMDDLITKRIPDRKTTRIVTTTGNYTNVNELKRVNIDKAKSVILLAKSSESASEEEKMESDIQSVKAIMAIMSCQGGKNELPIIAEIFHQEKRDIVQFFGDDNIIAIDSWDIMGKLLVQTSLTSGLEMVYNEILSFDGCEIYFYDADWKGVTFGELPYHFVDGIPLGIFNEEDGMVLRPGKEYKMKKDDQILILAEDDSTIDFESTALMKPKHIELQNTKLEQKQRSVIILGWHNVAEIYISESVDYLVEGSNFDIFINEPTKELEQKVDELKKEYPDFNITLTQTNPLELAQLKETNPFDYDTILILSQELSEQKPDKVDSDTLIILLQLRRIKSQLENVNTKIVTQVLNSDNQDIITQTDVDDFLISNKLITMILAQLSEETKIINFYDDIFSEDGSEIYVKSVQLYRKEFPVRGTFGDLIGLADQRDEVCLGIRYGDQSKNPETNFGVVLNLPKDEVVELNENDYLVVLSEDEL